MGNPEGVRQIADGQGLDPEEAQRLRCVQSILWNGACIHHSAIGKAAAAAFGEEVVGECVDAESVREAMELMANGPKS